MIHLTWNMPKWYKNSKKRRRERVKPGKLRLIKNIKQTLTGFNCSQRHSSHALWGVNHVCLLLDYVNIINWFILDMVCVAQRAQPGSSEWSGRVKSYWAEFSCHCWWQVCVTHTRWRHVFHWLPCAHTAAADGWTATELDGNWWCIDLFSLIHSINIMLYQLYCQWAGRDSSVIV